MLFVAQISVPEPGVAGSVQSPEVERAAGGADASCRGPHQPGGRAQARPCRRRHRSRHLRLLRQVMTALP